MAGTRKVSQPVRRCCYGAAAGRWSDVVRWLAAFAATCVLLTSPSRAAGIDTQDLSVADRLIEEAVVRGDVQALQQVYTEDFRFTHSTGDVQTKAQWLEAVALRTFTSRIVSAVQVESHGNAALTTGRLEVKTRDPSSGYTLRYVRLYQRVDGRWRLASHFTTELSPTTGSH